MLPTRDQKRRPRLRRILEGPSTLRGWALACAASFLLGLFSVAAVTFGPADRASLLKVRSLFADLPQRQTEVPDPVFGDAQIPTAFAAIVVAGVGNRPETDNAWLAAPAGVTLAVNPFSPVAREIAERAAAAGLGVLAEAQLDGAPQTPFRLHYEPVSPATAPNAALAWLSETAARLPQASGMAAAGGAQLLKDPAGAARLALALAQRQMYYLDSVREPGATGLAACRAAGVPALRRDVDLSAADGAAVLDAQVARLVGKALSVGHAIARIDASEPPDAVARVAERLKARGVQLVPLDAIAERAANATVKRPKPTASDNQAAVDNVQTKTGT